jgi:hypothetical protein
MTEWERCRPWIEAALVHAEGTHRIEDIADGIASGRFQFWPGKNCAAVTEIIVYPRLTALNFFLLGGDLTELLHEMEPAICKWGKAMGCSRVIGAGRKGFERVLRPLGYEPKWSYCAKELKT